MKIDPKIHIPYRRAGIIFHLLLLVGIGFGFTSNWENTNDKIILIIVIALLALSIISFIIFIWNTQLWSMVHKSKEKLDERESNEVSIAVSTSYTMFAIFTVIVFYLLSYFEIRIEIGLGSMFLLLAHILPACVLGFRLKEI